MIALICVVEEARTHKGDVIREFICWVIIDAVAGWTSISQPDLCQKG